MAAGIYRLFCTVSGKSYVGQSVNVARRVERHFKGLHEGQHYNVHLQHSFDLHGHDTFLAEVLEYCDQEMLKEREQYWIDHYGFENLYNMCPAAGSTAGIKLSEETRQRIGEAHKGKKYSDETRQRISNNHVGMKGKVHTKETRRRMSESHKGKKHSDEHRQRISEAGKGNQNGKGWKPSDEQRQRIGEASKGRRHSEEARLKISEAQKARWARYRAEKEATQ